jgi:hypothetical protein
VTSTVPSPETENFLGLLDGVRKAGSGWVARCPCRNDDSNPSLSVGQGADGRVLVTCHRGMSCNVEEICASVGLQVSDLMPKKDEFDSPYKNETRISSPPKKNQPTPKQVAPKTQEQPVKQTLVATYDYTDENGKVLFQKLRYVDENGKKTFRQRKPDGKGGWEYSLGDIPKVLYNLPAVVSAKQYNAPVWVVEGEKDADTLIEAGFIATTMPGGAGKWLDIHTEPLAGLVVEIVADRDEVGIRHALDVRKKLTDAGCDAQVWLCPSHKDITDHLSAGGQIEDLVAYEDEHQSEYQSDSDSGFNEVVIEDKAIDEDLSPEALALAKLKEMLERDDLNTKQKIAKSNLILSTATVSYSLDTGRLVHWNDFLKETDGDSYEWVIPGLIEKGERVIVVAAEGVGKTMLARQVGLLSAAGIHPFSFQPMPPIKTLTVDLENPDRIIRRTGRSIAAQAMAHARVSRLNAELLTRPSGMDLLKASDRALLEETLDKVKPELLVIGPLYKAFLDPGGRTSESIALEVAKYLDTIRTIYKCALWIEHHAPLGTSMTSRDLRPFGSAVWSRWPEFGISLQPDPTALGAYVYDVRHFRGARDERQWPTKMKRGVRFPFEVIEWSKAVK